MLRPSIKRSIWLFLFAVILQGTQTLSAASQTTSSSAFYFPIIAHGAPRPPTTAAWIGPGGGVIADLIFDPVNSNVVFAAALGGGIYKSTDGGLTWRNVSQGLGSLEITAIEVSPKSSLILYAGTYKEGVYKSINGGESWYWTGAGIQSEAITYAIEIDPTRSKRIYVATRGISNDGVAPWNGIVYKSDDGGTTWSPKLTNAGGSAQEDWAYDLSIHPGSPNVLFAATHEHGAYRSQDYGETWQAINNGVSDLTGRAIEHDPNSSFPGIVYMGVFHKTGIFKSLNGGDLWSLYNHNIAEARIYKLTIDPNNSAKIYLATFDHGVMRSTNSGINWYPAGLASEIILDVVVQPGNSQKLLSGTIANGLFRSTNSGDTWSHSQQGLNASTVSTLLVQPGDSQILYASLAPGWVARSTNGGGSWSDYHTNINDQYVNALVSHPIQSNLLYALTETAGLYRRDTLSGGGWLSIGNNLPAATPQTSLDERQLSNARGILEDLFPGDFPIMTRPESIDQVTPLLTMIFAPTTPVTAYLGTGGAGIYKSTDGGENWFPTGLSNLTVRSLAVSPHDPLKIYAATNASGSIYRSTDGGSSWINLPLPNGTAYALAISGTSPEILYAGTSVGVFKYDGGWMPLGLDGTAVTSITVHPANPNLIYAGTTQGVYLSYDRGMIWEPGPLELDGIGIESISFDPNDFNVTYYTTQAHGVLRESY